MKTIQRYYLILNIMLFTKSYPPMSILVLDIIPLLRRRWVIISYILESSWRDHRFSSGSGRAQRSHIHQILQFINQFGGVILSHMENKDKVLQYYKTGRYECDYDFYDNLRSILKYLNLYEFCNNLQNQIKIVKQIKQLTEVNSKCLDDDYDDQEGICQTYKIRQLLNTINTKQIASIIEECEQLKWEPYSIKVYKTLEGKRQYEDILERLKKTIHSEQFLIDSMIFTSLFQFRNGQLLKLYIQIYSQSVQYYLNFLNQNKPKLQYILENSNISNINSISKTKSFVIILYKIIKVCLRFCQILKILTGKNNLSLKFTVIKKQIDKIIKRNSQQWKINDEKDEIFNILPQYKRQLKSGINKLEKTSICSFCLKKLTNNEMGFHLFCKYLVENKNKFVIQ